MRVRSSEIETQMRADGQAFNVWRSRSRDARLSWLQDNADSHRETEKQTSNLNKRNLWTEQLWKQ